MHLVYYELQIYGVLLKSSSKP